MDKLNDSSRNIEQDIETSIYYKTLCSSGLSFLNKQHNLIETKRNNLVDNKQKLVYNNYDSFIKFSNFSKDLIDDFQEIENHLQNLNKTIPEFTNKCEQFSVDSRKISTRWKNVSSMLAKYPQLIEFLEIPQLLNNCVRTFYYEDALKIYNFIFKFCTRYKRLAPIFENMLIEIDKGIDVMIAQILKEMNGNIQMPVCIKLVNHLRQTDRFSEEQLRIDFLLARDVWFQSSLNKNSSNYSLSNISKITEVFRINIFDVVTQYRAIFPDFDSESLVINKVNLRKNSMEINSKIINSWLMLKIDQYMSILETNLDHCIQYNSRLSLDSVIDQCFYFGLSMSKIGADIRPKLILTFNDFIKRRFKFKIDQANKRFEESMGDIFKNTNNKSTVLRENSTIDYEEANMEEFPIIMTYYNDMCAIFNEICNNIPLALISYFVTIVNSSLVLLVNILKSYIKNYEYGMNQVEFAKYLRVCNAFKNEMLPLLNKSFQQLCPVSEISKKFAITSFNLSQMKMLPLFELNIKTPIEEINCIIQDISTKL